MRFRLCIATLALAGCVDKSASRASADTSRRDSGRAVAPPASSVAALTPARAEDVAWFAEADSALRRQLERELYLSAGGFAPGFRDCGDAGASENPTSLVAATSARIIGHDTISLGDAGDFGAVESPTKTTGFRVEVLSAARMIPAWILELPPDSAKHYDQAYGITATPHVDTFDIGLIDLGTVTPRWAMCDPTRVGSAPGYGYWSFAHASDDWVEPVRWSPAGATWSRVRELADSLRAAHRSP
jgi:hypothetical protein